MTDTERAEAKSPVFGAIMPLLKAVLTGYILSLIMLFLLAFILWLTGAKETVIRPVVLVIELMALLISGRLASQNTQLRGFLAGGLAGLVFRVLLYFIGILACEASPIGLTVLLQFVYAFCAGAIGGIWGKNSRPRARKKFHAKKA